MNKERIIVKEDDKEIIIDAFVDTQKQTLLNIWLILWTLAGLVIVTQFFTTLGDGLTVYLLVYLAFWAYFEFKVIYAYRWRRFGREVISVKDEFLSINREIAGRGIPGRYELSWIKNLRINDVKKTSFFTAMGQSYWSPGNEQITFEHKGREIFFAQELTDKESLKVLKTLKRFIQGKSN